MRKRTLDRGSSNHTRRLTIRTMFMGFIALGIFGAAAACAPVAAPAPAPAATSAPAAATAAPAAATSAPAAATTAPSSAIKRGGILNLGEVNDPVSFDPHNRSNASATVLQRMVYQSLTRHNPRTMAVEPVLATGWEYTSPTEIIWHLREGVKFHDGSDFTAEDAKWNIDRIIDPATGNPFAAWYAAIESTEVVDDYTLKMTLKQPDPVLPGKFATMRVVGFAPANSDPAELATKPVGTGPFRLTEWVQNDHATFEAFKDYWEMGEDGRPLPYVDGLSVKFATAEDTRIAALRAGQMDIALLSADGAQRLANEPNLNIINGAEGVFTVIKMNKRFKPFTDPRVRKALDLALDKNDIIEKALGGAGILTGPIVSGWEDYGIAPEDLPYKQNIEEAKRLMAEAGYADGFDVTAVSLPEGHPAGFYPSIATAADAWKQIGVNVNIEQLELGAWLEKNNKLDYDMLIGNRGFRGDPIDILYPHYHPNGSDNPIGYDNPDVKMWIEQAQVEPDREKRRELYMKIQEQVLEDVPWIFLWATVENYGVQKYVKGYDHVAFDAYKDLIWTSWLDK